MTSLPLELDAHIHNLRREYFAKTISEPGLVTLASFDKAIALESGTHILEGMGVRCTGSLQPDGSLWIAVPDNDASNTFKAILREQGYTNLRTFEGWMGWCPQRRLILQASKANHFSDGQGRSLRLLDLVRTLGVEPLYTYAFGGQISIDIDNEDQALAVYEYLLKASLSQVSVGPDDLGSFDVWRVQCEVKKQK